MRIVSLLPAATEIVAALGASDHLVGVTHECDYPVSIASRARVTHSALPAAHTSASAAMIDAAVREQQGTGTSLFTLDARRIRALHPDLLLTQALCDVCAISETDVRAFAATLTPPPHIVTLGGRTIDGIFEDIREVANAIGAGDEAEELLAGDRDRMRRIHETLKAAKAPRPRMAVIEWTDPVYLAGHWVPEQIRRAGGINALGEAGAHSTTVTHEALAAAAPDLLLFAPCGYALEAAAAEAQRCLADPSWDWVGNRPVWALDANALTSRPGPRIVDGIEAIARIGNPDLFSPLDPTHARRIR